MSIGKVYLPDSFYQSMLGGKLLFIEVPKEERIARLVSEYACYDKSLLQAVLEHLGKYMGTYQAREVLIALQNDDFISVAEITLAYYDKLYDNSLSRRPIQNIIRISLPSGDISEHTQMILNEAERMDSKT